MKTTVNTTYHGAKTLDLSVRAVAAGNAVPLDSARRSLATGEIDREYVATIATFDPGDVVFFESPDPTDCLDGATTESQAATRIWWLAEIMATPSGA